VAVAFNYSSTAVSTTLSGSIDNAATTINVAATTGFPAAPFKLTLAPDTGSEEIVKVTAVVGLALTVVRGWDGSVALSHASGDAVRHQGTGEDFRLSRLHEDASANVHGLGVSDTVLGRTQTATVENKTISSAANTLTIANAGVLTFLGANWAAALAAALDTDVATVLGAMNAAWPAILAAAPGTGWAAALAANLDTDAATVLGAMGTGWPAILAAAPGSGWANALDTALGSNWETALAATLAGDWTNVLDSPINGGWLNQFAGEPGNIVRRIATAYFQNTVGPITTTETQVLNITAATVTGRTYRITATMPYDSSVVTDAYFLRIREDSVSGAEVQGRRISANVAGVTAFDATIEGEYTADANENKVFSVTIVRTSGTGQLNRTGSSAAPAIIYVDHVW
jgi:hypothetical protein